MTEQHLLGIHHVTAICGNPQTNLDFYTGVLGLRLVKLTVNFDDPSAYHLYYGDTIGSPGSILTFFNYGEGSKGYAGAGNFVAITYAVPVGSLGFWKERLAKYQAETVEGSFGEEILTAKDPDGLVLRFVEREELNPKVWPALGHQHSIQRIDGVTLGTRTDASLRFTEGSMQGEPVAGKTMASGNEIHRFKLGASNLDILPTVQRNLPGPGTMHHVAWRVSDSLIQEGWLAKLRTNLANVSDVRDRTYFKSIYFREPGGALHEIATDGPGFTIDETVEKLGGRLQLPPQYEPHRQKIEEALPPLKLPAGVV